MADDNSQTGPIGVPNAAPTPHETGVPQAAPAGTPVSAIPATEQDLKNDISKILKDIKLPERRESGLAQQKKNVIEVKSFDTVLGADARAEIADKKESQAAAPETPMPQPNPKDPEDDGSVMPLHTFKQDLQHVVRDNNISIVRAASLEQAKMRPGPIEDNFPPPARRSYAGVIVLTLVLLFLGAAAVFGVIFVMSQSGAALPPHTSTSIVFAEQTVSYPVDGKSPSTVKNELAQARAGGSSSLGSITQIVPVIQTGGLDQNGNAAVRPLTLTEFFTAIGARPPADLVRALGSTFFFGIHTVDKNAPILVIPVVSYDRAFAGMLAWETTLNSDLAPIFTAVPMNAFDTSGLPITRTFSDDVMRNYDVRELKDDSGTIELYYSFPSRDILVIAESPYTFTEILSRLQANSNL